MEVNQRIELLEGELKIVKNEVKEILAEIRAALLDRQNPFAPAGGPAGFDAGRVRVVRADVPDEPDWSEAPEGAPWPPSEPTAPPAPEPAAAEPAAAPPARMEPPAALSPAPAVAPPQPLRLVPPEQPVPDDPGQPLWGLLTISSLMLWSDDAARRIGPRRLTLMLELCEIAGYIGPQTRTALLRVVDADCQEPERSPTPNECLLTLRELQALLHDEQPDFVASQAHRGSRRRR